ncbi:hypothetical protein PR001_g31430 [Phytophthora rubi]|uniref:Uncharacterized protein n=1 Tax=Phytophthora rubi TaxID=129364 RepID=A0A6A3GLE9_9STRA|nr:hypothetical protein PR001_g31430 [Phytophthora rubi]
MLAVLLSPMPAAAMLVVLLSLSPLPLRSPCRCGRAHRNATRRSPVPPPCSPSRHVAVAVPAAAMPAVLRSLCRPPQCPPCCARCAGRRHARHASLAVPATATLAVKLWPGSPKCLPTVAHAAEIVQERNWSGQDVDVDYPRSMLTYVIHGR